MRQRSYVAFCKRTTHETRRERRAGLLKAQPFLSWRPRVAAAGSGRLEEECVSFDLQQVVGSLERLDAPRLASSWLHAVSLGISGAEGELSASFFMTADPLPLSRCAPVLLDHIPRGLVGGNAGLALQFRALHMAKCG